MPAALDPLAARVARRYEARLVVERTAREVQRRREGLLEVDDGEDDVAAQSRAVTQP